MTPKCKYPWWDQYSQAWGLKVTSRDPKTRKADTAAICCVCQIFRRETAPSESELQKRKKTKAFQAFTKDKFNPSNIKSHMQNQHPIKWKKYIEARDNMETDPDAFEPFFHQLKLQAFYFESQDVKRFYSINKDIIEVVVKKVLIEDQEKLDGDIAMPAFKAVKDDSGEVLSYTVAVKKKAQFNHVLGLVATGLSFRQNAKVIHSDRERISTRLRRLVRCHMVKPRAWRALDVQLVLQSLLEIMKASWAFSIGADEATEQGQDSHLNVRIRFPPVVGFKGGPAVEHGFHLLAIPLLDLTYSGRVYADLLIKVLSALCPDWRMKLLGSSTDGAGNMTGHSSGFSTLSSQ